MTNLTSLRTNLSENGFELLSPSAALQIRGGGKSKNSGKRKNSGKNKNSKKSRKSNKYGGGGHGYCPPSYHGH
jgi:hypothetical protein